MMTRGKKILIGVFLVIGLIFLFLYNFAIDGRFFQKLEWKKLQSNPYIQSIGHWKDNEAETKVIIPSDIIPHNITYRKWRDLMENNDFTLHKNQEKCDLFNSAMEFLGDYQACAFKPVGSYTLTTCNYWYIVAANFEDNLLTESVGTRFVFMC
ncbi:MAG: hypothetical protein ABJ275_08450 [Maricaulaceae bacterium]